MIMELADNTLHMFKNVGENKNMMGRDIKDLKKTQIKILKVKYTICGIQNTPAKINIRLDISEENISEQETNYLQ